MFLNYKDTQTLYAARMDNYPNARLVLVDIIMKEA